LVETISLENFFDLQSLLNGSVILQGIKASDADQPGPYSTVHFSVLPGPHSVRQSRSVALVIRRSSLPAERRAFKANKWRSFRFN
jgi:hypothetical protein